MSNIFSSITQLAAIVTDAMVKILDRTITVVTLLNAVTVTGPGASVQVDSLRKTFHIMITGIAVVTIEASLDNVTFGTLFPSVSSTSLLSDIDPWLHIRANVVSITSGSVTVKMGTGA